MKDDGWETVLKEPPKKALDRFVEEGLIQPSGLHGKLDHEFKLPALKTLLEERNSKVSGKKDVLIERLIELDAYGMERLVKGRLVFECTEQGLVRSNSYLDEEKKKKTAVELQVFQALQNHEFDKACQIANSYHKQEVFSSGIECDSTFIKSIFAVKPKILKNFNDHQLDALRIVAGMMQLLYCRKASDWLPSGFHLDYHLKAESAARMLIFHCYYIKNLNDLIRSGFKKAKILVVEDSCEQCKKLKDKTYAINKVPELPFEECTCEMGCRCILVVDSNS